MLIFSESFKPHLSKSFLQAFSTLFPSHFGQRYTVNGEMTLPLHCSARIEKRSKTLKRWMVSGEWYHRYRWDDTLALSTCTAVLKPSKSHHFTVQLFGLGSSTVGWDDCPCAALTIWWGFNSSSQSEMKRKLSKVASPFLTDANSSTNHGQMTVPGCDGIIQLERFHNL